MNEDWTVYAARVWGEIKAARVAEAAHLSPGDRVRFYLARTAGKYKLASLARLLGVSVGTVRRVTNERVAAGSAWRDGGWIINTAESVGGSA